jgi:thiamine kinase-like enzyme
MSFLLSSQNVYNYLSDHKLCTEGSFDASKIELKPAKNFNLLLTLKTGQKLLVKQERHLKNGKTAGDFFREWHVQELIHKLPELTVAHHLFPEVLHFDAEHSIIVFNYVDDYQDLAEFYAQEKTFPIVIASQLGESIASIHRLTLQNAKYETFLKSSVDSDRASEKEIPVFIRGIDRITPDVFGMFTADGLRFLALYQRYESLGKAIGELSASYQPCCFTHNDLKLNNLLVHNDWEQHDRASAKPILRFIDWEHSGWGDPAFDLGTLVASYLQNWLGSLVVSKDITIEESLRMAATPLEKLQPSLQILIETYLNTFPEILQHQSNFIQRVIQFSGFSLIQQIQAMTQYQKVFNNTGICMLQVAKSFLCRPAQSISTIFGRTEAELIKNAKTV